LKKDLKPLTDMLKFLQQPAHQPEQTGPEADARYKSLRLQVFLGAFIGTVLFTVALILDAATCPEKVLVRKEELLETYDMLQM